jgi:Integral membrane protein DUF92
VVARADTCCPQVKHDVKARLTLSASGASGGEGARTHVQVLANSAVASVLILLHVWQLSKSGVEECWGWKGDLLVVGIVAYVACAVHFLRDNVSDEDTRC